MARRSLAQYRELSEHPFFSRAPAVAYAQRAAAPKTAEHQRTRLARARQSASPTPGQPPVSLVHRLQAKFPILNVLASSAWKQWVVEYLRYRIGKKHSFNAYSGTSGAAAGVFPLSAPGHDTSPSNPIRISLAGDWGTGTEEAARVADSIRGFDPHFTIHLGDVYYVGDASEVSEHCLGVRNPATGFDPTTWPIGSVGSFALNGNHEMYALGTAYFDLFLPRLGMRPAAGQRPGGQPASYFALENEWWRIIGLDTGYHSVGIPILEKVPLFYPDCRLPDQVVQWLRQVIRPNDDQRGLILLSHHQYFSAFDEWIPKAAQQLAGIINRPVLWFWGHEHRFATYCLGRFKDGIPAFGRCIGHGGMPVDLATRVDHPECATEIHDNRRYVNASDPADLFVGYNGFANITFEERAATVEYRDLENTLVLREAWEVAADGTLAHRVLDVLRHPDVSVRSCK